MRNYEGQIVNIFESIHKDITSYFHNILKDPKRENIAKIIKISLYFTRFISEEKKQMLIDKVSKDELQTVMDSFKKDKLLAHLGWMVSYFQDFLSHCRKIY